MFAQSVDENIGGQITNTVSAPGEWGKVAFIFFGILIGSLVILLMIAYFVRKKILPKSERKAKVLRLP